MEKKWNFLKIFKIFISIIFATNKEDGPNTKRRKLESGKNQKNRKKIGFRPHLEEIRENIILMRFEKTQKRRTDLLFGSSV